MFALALMSLAALPRSSSAVVVPLAPKFSVSCLSSGDGYLRARLAGALQASIDWPNSGTHCEGGSRPGGRGLRLSFYREPAGEPNLLFVFGVAAVRAGEAAKAVGVNVTVFERGTSRVFGTQSDSRCTVDSLTQTAIGGTPRSKRFRVEARGFCTQPAHAVRGDGSLLVTTFDFAGLVVQEDEDDQR
jgi:hypothetical protein